MRITSWDALFPQQWPQMNVFGLVATAICRRYGLKCSYFVLCIANYCISTLDSHYQYSKLFPRCLSLYHTFQMKYEWCLWHNYHQTYSPQGKEEWAWLISKSQKWKLEWSFFLDINSRRKYNNQCRWYERECNQSFRAIIIRRPRYKSKRSIVDR